MLEDLVSRVTMLEIKVEDLEGEVQAARYLLKMLAPLMPKEFDAFLISNVISALKNLTPPEGGSDISSPAEHDEFLLRYLPYVESLLREIEDVLGERKKGLDLG